MILTFLFAVPAITQDVNVVAETERAFAARAAEAGTRTAFLEFAAGDAVLFLPDRIRAADYWKEPADSTAALVWAPNFADISANGKLAYTTGNWEYRPKGRSGEPSAFGQFVTVWQRQADGGFKYSLDIGISHARPPKFAADWVSPNEAGVPAPAVSVAHIANRFFETVGSLGARAAYKDYLSESARTFREGQMPMIGRKAFFDAALDGVRKIDFRKRSVFVEAGDLAFVTNTYVLTRRDGTAENGNFLQIWKFREGKWQIVLDIFKPVPAK